MNEHKVSLHPLGFEEAVKVLVRAGGPKRKDSQAEGEGGLAEPLKALPAHLGHQTGEPLSVVDLPVRVPEVHLAQVHRQEAIADVVERPVDAALDQAPVALDGLCMDGSPHVLDLMIDGLMRQNLIHVPVDRMLIGNEYGRVDVDHLDHYRLDVLSGGLGNHG